MRTRDKSHRVGFCVPFACLAYAVITFVLFVTGCQSYISDPPWRREYSDEEWLEMVQQPEHQPRTVWLGNSHGSIYSTSQWGMSLDGISFYRTPARVLERQWSEGLFHADPLLFLPLFDSDDPDDVLTGIYIYDKWRFLDLSDAEFAQLAAAYRKARDHRDTRVRYAVIETMVKKNCLSVDDVAHGLSDASVAVRNLTARWIKKVFDNRSIYLPIGATDEYSKTMRARRFTQTKRELAPVLLDHLNDTSFFVRAKCSWTFRGSLAANIDGESTGHRFDYIRADWQSRVDAQKRWKDWWAKHGEVALHGGTSQVTARH